MLRRTLFLALALLPSLAVAAPSRALEQAVRDARLQRRGDLTQPKYARNLDSLRNAAEKARQERLRNSQADDEKRTADLELRSETLRKQRADVMRNRLKAIPTRANALTRTQVRQYSRSADEQKQRMIEKQRREHAACANGGVDERQE